MTTTPPALPALQVADIERRLRWRVLPTLVFVTMLSGLALGAYLSLTAAHGHPSGLPDDPRAREAFELLAGRTPAATNALRWRSTVLGGAVEDAPPDAYAIARVDAARRTLDELVRGRWTDPRPLAARAALDVVAHDYARAAARYRRACELAPHYGEARLGAGVALALEADRTPDSWQARALRLQAIAQFAMVDSVDAEYPAALHDRARVLLDVGRVTEARFWSDRFVVWAMQER